MSATSEGLPAAPGADVAVPAGRTWARAAVVVGVLLLALAMRLVGITATQPWPDEGITLTLIRVSWWELLTKLPVTTDHPGLPFLAFKAWSLLFASEWGLRLLPVAMGVATVGVLMRVAYRIDPRAAIPTGLLAAVTPVPVHYSQELRGYSLLFLLAAATFWAAQRVAERPASWRRAGVLALVAALAAHTHAVGLFVFPMGVAFLAVVGPRQREMPGKSWLSQLGGMAPFLRAGGVWLVLVSPMIWFNLHWSDVHRGGWWVHPVSLFALQKYAEEYAGFSVIDAWVGSRRPRAVWQGFALERVILASMAALAIVTLADQRLRRGLAALALAAATYLGLMLVASMLSLPSIITRTLLPGWAPVLVLLGLGPSAGGGRGRRIAAWLAIGTLTTVYAVAWVWFAQAGSPWRPPTDESYQWVRARLGPHDVVVSVRTCEDLTAYQLSDVVAGERLLSTGRPTFAGSPPVRKMVLPGDDAEWPMRLRAAIAVANEASGGHYSVWLIEFGIPMGPAPGNIAGVLSEQHWQSEQFFREDSYGTTATRFVPVTATRPAR